MAATLEDIGEHARATSEISHAGIGRKSSEPHKRVNQAFVRGRRECSAQIFKKMPTQKTLAPQREAARKGTKL